MTCFGNKAGFSAFIRSHLYLRVAMIDAQYFDSAQELMYERSLLLMIKKIYISACSIKCPTGWIYQQTTQSSLRQKNARL